MTIILEGRNIKKIFDQSIVLNDLSFKIEKGKFYTIFGPSGCGKSTFLQICGLLDNAFTGQLIFNGQNIHDIKGYHINQYRKYKIGFIYQRHYLLPELNIFHNIALPLILQKKSSKIIVEKVNAIADQIHLANKLRSFPGELSIGQQQRIAVARSIIHAPEIIIADEPTSSLDKKNTAKIIELFDKMRIANNITLLMATHDVEITQRSDHIIYL